MYIDFKTHKSVIFFCADLANHHLTHPLCMLYNPKIYLLFLDFSRDSKLLIFSACKLLHLYGRLCFKQTALAQRNAQTLHWKSNYIQSCNYVMKVYILYFFLKIWFLPLEISISDSPTVKWKYRKYHINNRFLFCLKFLRTRRNDQVALTLTYRTFTRLENWKDFFFKLETA